jgi:hypothetical protein
LLPARLATLATLLTAALLTATLLTATLAAAALLGPDTRRARYRQDQTKEEAFSHSPHLLTRGR